MLKVFFQEPDVILVLIPLSEIFFFFLSLYAVIFGVMKFCNDAPEFESSITLWRRVSFRSQNFSGKI